MSVLQFLMLFDTEVDSHCFLGKPAGEICSPTIRWLYKSKQPSRWRWRCNFSVKGLKRSSLLSFSKMVKSNLPLFRGGQARKWGQNLALYLFLGARILPYLFPAAALLLDTLPNKFLQELAMHLNASQCISMHHTQFQCKVHFSSTINNISPLYQFFQEYFDERQNWTEDMCSCCHCWNTFILVVEIWRKESKSHLNFSEHTSCWNIFS